VTEEKEPKVRPWVRWVTALVWLLTAATVLVLSLMHLPATATVTVLVREVSFVTDSSSLFDSADQDRFSISGPFDITLSGPPAVNSNGHAVSSVEVHGPSTAASCAFYNVRTSPLRLLGDTGILLLWPKNADPNSLIIRLRGRAAGDLSPNGSASAASSYSCSGVEQTATTLGEMNGVLSDEFGTTFGTSGDAQLSFRRKSSQIVSDSQIRVSGPLQIAHIDPAHPGQEKGSLLDPYSKKSRNQVTFDDSSRNVEFNSKDLIVIDPGSDFYIRSLSADHGIQLELHGTVRNILTGAGSKDYKSCMPSVFDTLDSKKRIYGAIPGAVTFILTLLETLGLLPRKTK
jgi:hypothetical protein